jgi:hypothetical protein
MSSSDLKPQTQAVVQGGGGGGPRGKQSKIKLNILPGLTYFPCDTPDLHRSRESKFASKLVVVPKKREDLRVYTFPNDICILTLSEVLDPRSVKSVRFLVDISDDSISGKKKRGAVLLKAGHRIASLCLQDDSEVIVSTPIGGHLLEINTKLIASSSSSSSSSAAAAASDSGLDLLRSDPSGAGYFAVVKPNTQFPTSDFPDYASLAAHVTQKQERICFSWKSSGTCQYGNNCKFNHPISLSNSDMNMNISSNSSGSSGGDILENSYDNEQNSSDPLTMKRKIDDI